MRPWFTPTSIQESAAALWRRHVGVPGRNRLRNGGFVVNQRRPGAAFTSASPFANGDKAPILDYWLLQSDGADRADVTQELTVIPTGAYAAVRLDAETITAAPNGEKFGILQVIESRDCIDLRGGKVSAQFKVRTGTTGAGVNITAVRAQIVEWTGTVDAPTLPIAAGGAWGAEGANPTLAAGWAYISAIGATALTTAYQTILIENVSVGASANNLGLFIWIDDKDTVADSFLYVADAKLEDGPYCTRFEQPDFTNELVAAGRRFRKTFAYATAPVQNVGTTIGTMVEVAATGDDVLLQWDFGMPPMRAAGTVVTYNPAAANALARNVVGAADITLGTVTASDRRLTVATNDSGDIANGESIFLHATVDAEFQ